MIYKAMELLDVNKEELNKFSAIDTFNNNNILEGFICRRSDHRYGALVIFKVNDEETQQIVWATPKLHYPFDNNGNYNWPDVLHTESYEKLDGINILAYRYSYKGNIYVTYKTRLTATLKDSKHACIKSMWKEYISRNSWVRQCIDLNPRYNLSFELFGSRIPITIKYNIPLEVNLLFGIRENDHCVRPLSELYIINAKVPQKYSIVDGGKSNEDFYKFFNKYEPLGYNNDVLTEVYNYNRKFSSDKNKDGLITEGMVMYAHVGEPSWRMFKCKPEEIERIHWTASGIIPKISLFTTGMNVFETNDDPVIEDYLELLKEEYPQELLTKNTYKIEKIWDEVCNHIDAVKTINEIWIMAIEKGYDITKDKSETMRFISQYFPKWYMKKVGTIILQQAGLLKNKKRI